MNNNEVKLKVQGNGVTTIITGWSQLRITRGVERLPSDFDLLMTEAIPDIDQVEITPGMTCQVCIDDDVVVTGYIDRYIPSISANQHQIQVIGRGLCSDLVDCSAVWPGSQFLQQTAAEISQKLCDQHGLKVLSEVATAPITNYNINLGESSFTVIHKMCQISQLLCYENEYGNLVLSQAGLEGMSGGLVEGVNIESATFNHSMDQRYSEYIVIFAGAAVSADTIKNPGINFFSLPDVDVKRQRTLYLLPESGDAGMEVARQMAIWEKNRRQARSYIYNVTTSIWRDLDGKLWTPNKFVPVHIPTLRLNDEKWLISEVTFRRDVSGTHCDLTIMPPEAFTPNPIVINPSAQDAAPVFQGRG